MLAGFAIRFGDRTVKLSTICSTFPNRTPIDHERDPRRPLVGVIHDACGDTSETDLAAQFRGSLRIDLRNFELTSNL